jgi:ABC-type sugar transport system ATPase subunit
LGRAQVRFEGVTRHFAGAAEPAVADVDLTVDDGEVVVLTGPPGSGKTTLLRLAAGLEVPDQGRVLVGDGRPEDPGNAEVALIFQNYAIYPHLSVAANIALPLERSGQSSAAIAEAVDGVVHRLGLEDLRKRPASSLSAGERMRVVLARSLVRRPDVLLMDEPLANLQPEVRADLADRLVAAREAFEITTLYVTADPSKLPPIEARVIRVEAGRLLPV